MNIWMLYWCRLAVGKHLFNIHHTFTNLHTDMKMIATALLHLCYCLMWIQFVTTLYPVMVLTCRLGIFHRTLKAVQLIVSSWMSNGGLRRSGLYKHAERHHQWRKQNTRHCALGNIDQYLNDSGSHVKGAAQTNRELPPTSSIPLISEVCLSIFHLIFLFFQTAKLPFSHRFHQHTWFLSNKQALKNPQFGSNGRLTKLATIAGERREARDVP